MDEPLVLPADVARLVFKNHLTAKELKEQVDTPEVNDKQVVLVVGGEFDDGKELIAKLEKHFADKMVVFLGKDYLEKLRSIKELGPDALGDDLLVEIDSLSQFVPDVVITNVNRRTPFIPEQRSERIPHLKRGGFQKGVHKQRR